MKISDKVVFVGHSISPNHKDCPALNISFDQSQFVYTNKHLLKRNGVYVISKVIKQPHWNPNTYGLVLVGGITCHFNLDNTEVGYHSGMFRKLEEVQAANLNIQHNLK